MNDPKHLYGKVKFAELTQKPNITELLLIEASSSSSAKIHSDGEMD